MPQDTFSSQQTPCLLLSTDRLTRNLQRMDAALGGRVVLRPHMKTAKSVEVARLAAPAPGAPITVSTLKEAEAFAAGGFRDILYAVGIDATKLARVLALLAQGVDLTILLDSLAQARAVADASRAAGRPVPALIEIDCDGLRSGVRPDDEPTLRAIADTLGETGSLRGVLTHASASYWTRDTDETRALSRQECDAARAAATLLRRHGHAVPIVSVGSTPTALFAPDLAGITEMRAGVFMFFDLVQAGAGTCGLDDIALSVLSTVIGHQPHRNRLVIDAGWMALSRDRGTDNQRVNQGYGLVCDAQGRPYPDLLVLETNQEHGIVGLREGSRHALPALPIGSRVRILPVHACATAAQHPAYVAYERDGEDARIVGTWPRFMGW